MRADALMRTMLPPAVAMRTSVQVMCLLFTTGMGVWVWNLRQHRANAHRIHYLMTALGAFKVLTLLTECLMFHYVRVTGEPDGWNIAYYIFTLLRGVFLFTVIVLIGTGWSYMTPFLGDNNRKILMLVIPLQVRRCTAQAHTAARTDISEMSL
jgi:G protein-coupled receptor 107